jgi:hypothetical protein
VQLQTKSSEGDVPWSVHSGTLQVPSNASSLRRVRSLPLFWYDYFRLSLDVQDDMDTVLELRFCQQAPRAQVMIANSLETNSLETNSLEPNSLETNNLEQNSLEINSLETKQFANQQFGNKQSGTKQFGNQQFGNKQFENNQSGAKEFGN